MTLFQEDLHQKGLKSSVRWSAASVLKIWSVGLWQRKELLENNHLACTKGQMELRMVQSIRGTWGVAVQVDPPASPMSGPGLLRSPGLLQELFHRLLWMCSQGNLIFEPLDRFFWKGRCRKAELVHVVRGSRTKLFLPFFFCGFTALLTPSKLSGKEPEAN